VKPGRLGTPERVLILEGHKLQVTNLAFSPVGSRLASSSQDGTVRIWDVSTGQEALCLKGHAGHVRALAFGSSGTKLVSCGAGWTIKIWDAAPLTPASAVEREATGLLAGLFGKPLCGADVIDFVKTTPTIRPQVRQRALALVNPYREEKDPDRYHQAAWDTVRRPYLTAPPYRLALRQAQTACRLAPGEDKYMTTLGVALYRVGRYPEARAMLTKAVQPRENDAHGLAFLAMAQHRLDEPRPAQETLARLRECMKQPGRAEDAEAQGFLREAEVLMRGPVTEHRESACFEPAAARCSEVIIRHDFAASPCHQAGEDSDVDARSQKVNRPVRKHRVGPTGVKAVDFAIVGAVDGTGSQARDSVVRRTLAVQQTKCGPAAAITVKTRSQPARQSIGRPADSATRMVFEVPSLIPVTLTIRFCVRTPS
jgi:hypothetical protein